MEKKYNVYSCENCCVNVIIIEETKKRICPYCKEEGFLEHWETMKECCNVKELIGNNCEICGKQII